MSARQVLLFAALAATLAAVWWVERRSDEAAEEVVAAVARRPAGGAVATPIPPPAAVAPRPSAERFRAQGPNLFPRQSWRPPPPPPPRLAPPPPPAPPALPFTYLGRWQEGDAEVLFLAQGQAVHNLRKGDRVGQWRLDEAGPGSLTFTYLPLDMQQRLRIAP